MSDREPVVVKHDEEGMPTGRPILEAEVEGGEDFEEAHVVDESGVHAEAGGDGDGEEVETDKGKSYELSFVTAEEDQSLLGRASSPFEVHVTRVSAAMSSQPGGPADGRETRRSGRLTERNSAAAIKEISRALTPVTAAQKSPQLESQRDSGLGVSQDQPTVEPAHVQSVPTGTSLQLGQEISEASPSRKTPASFSHTPHEAVGEDVGHSSPSSHHDESTDNDASPVPQFIRKSSFSFASLPPREPLLGARTSTTETIRLGGVKRSSWYGRRTLGRSMGGRSTLPGENEVIGEDGEEREESDTEKERERKRSREPEQAEEKGADEEQEEEEGRERKRSRSASYSSSDEDSVIADEPTAAARDDVDGSKKLVAEHNKLASMRLHEKIQQLAKLNAEAQGSVPEENTPVKEPSHPDLTTQMKEFGVKPSPRTDQGRTLRSQSVTDDEWIPPVRSASTRGPAPSRGAAGVARSNTVTGAGTPLRKKISEREIETTRSKTNSPVLNHSPAVPRPLSFVAINSPYHTQSPFRAGGTAGTPLSPKPVNKRAAFPARQSPLKRPMHMNDGSPVTKLREAQNQRAAVAQTENAVGGVKAQTPIAVQRIKSGSLGRNNSRTTPSPQRMDVEARVSPRKQVTPAKREVYVDNEMQDDEPTREGRESRSRDMLKKLEEDLERKQKLEEEQRQLEEKKVRVEEQRRQAEARRKEKELQKKLAEERRSQEEARWQKEREEREAIRRREEEDIRRQKEELARKSRSSAASKKNKSSSSANVKRNSAVKKKNVLVSRRKTDSAVNLKSKSAENDTRRKTSVGKKRSRRG